MRDDPFKPLVAFALLIGAVLYLGGILYAGIESIRSDDEPDLNSFVTYAVVTLGAMLGTHFGAVLGISRATGGGPGRGGGGPGLTASRLANAAGMSGSPAGIHIAAAYFYFIALVLAGLAWLADGFSTDSAELIRTMGFDLVGVIAGIGAVVLAVNKN